MARKLNGPAESAPGADPQTAAAKALEDLYVLQPNVEVKIGERTITIGEYCLWDGMTARAIGKPLIDDLQAMTDSNEVADAGIETYMDLLAKHRDLVRELLILSVAEEDRDEAFLRSVKGPNADRLLMTWWATCSRFFWRAVVGRQRDRTMAKLRRNANPVGQTSSPPPPESAAASSGTSADATPSVN